MSRSSLRKISAVGDPHHLTDEYYRDLKRKHTLRLFFTYLVPIIVLTAFFYFQYDSMAAQSQRLHLKAIAENQSNTLDLFLSERLVNLANMIDDPRFSIPPDSATMAGSLEKLQRSSETFVDLGFFDSVGIQLEYVGPFPALEKRNYRSEAWYAALRSESTDHVITDIYLGFRQKPHFTIAVSRVREDRFVVLRATLDPKKIYEFISAAQGSQEVYTSIVNEDGFYQLVTPHIGTPLESASIVPPRSPRLGVERAHVEDRKLTYAYAWLRGAQWALVVQPEARGGGLLSGYEVKLLGISVAVMLLLFLIIVNRAGRLVTLQKESDRTRAQLEHAAKLASIGELAAGIAHEINNPLASISEEAGLVKDLMSLEFDQSMSREELREHLGSIQQSVFRCRDITQKLLRFVRKSDLDLQPHDIHELLNGVVDGLLGPGMAVSNLEVVKEYDEDLPKLSVDANQLQQVFLNIINNAADAIVTRPGKITISTGRDAKHVFVDIADSGKGMDPEEMSRIFMPFFTTKEVGKGTGLGLSVSYGIVKHLGGKLTVASSPGKGSTFTIELPIP